MKQKKPIITALGLCGNSVFLSVDHFHRPGETVHAAGLYAEPGGKGYNQAVAAARLGAEVRFITCVGDDADGRACLDFLRQEGVMPLARVVPELPSAYACILTDARGENRVTVFRGAAELLSPAFVCEQEECIAQSDMLLLNNEYPHAANLAVMELAQKHRVPVVWNPAPAREADSAFLQNCFLLTPNLSEAAALLGTDSHALTTLARQLRQRGVSCAIITLGGDGAALLDGNELLRFPARPTQARDTTGAGDTFTAAAAVALSEGKTLAQATEWACNAAGLSVAKRYVMPSLPTRAALEADYVTLRPTRITE